MNITLFGAMIRFHRKKAGLSQKELADLSGVGKTIVFDLEKGKETIRLNSFLKILEGLNIQMNFSGPLMEHFKQQYHEKG
ncbi:hypothetical protein ES705_14137 [subsurface metagenome]